LRAGRRQKAVRRRCAVAVVVVAVTAFALVGSAQTGAQTDITGTWNCCGTGGAAPETLIFTSGSGSLGGTAKLPSGTVFATIGGSITGNSVNIVVTYKNSFDPGYFATFKGTVSTDGQSMSGTWKSNQGQSGTWRATRAVAPPVLGKRADARPVSGVVLLKLPGEKAFTRLRIGQQIPLGSTLDATHGVVSLTAAKDRQGHTATGQFYAGAFRIGQTRTHGVELTDLALAGPKPTGCTANLASEAKRRPRRSLWGHASGNYRTVGSYASATERGTKWLTEDTCAGTLVKVAQGSVIVDDFPHHRTVRVTAPHSFLAHPGTGG
jgi:hypothetical protein